MHSYICIAFMSGHSKWSKVKHQKAVTDASKASDFTRASRALSIAVRNGGGVIDPEKNFKLRLAIEKAKDVNMPKDTIERAILRALGGTVGQLQELVYEAVGPDGICCIIRSVTDNKSRTVSLIKGVLGRHNFHLAAQGSVLYQFRIGEGHEYEALYPLEATDAHRSVVEKVTEALMDLDDVQEISANI